MGALHFEQNVFMVDLQFSLRLTIAYHVPAPWHEQPQALSVQYPTKGH
jgi:hypothetical protein